MLHGSFHQAVAQDRVCQEVGDCGSIPGRRSQALGGSLVSARRVQHGHLIAHIKRTAASRVWGPSPAERAEGLAMLARNTQDALQIRQRELAMAEASAAATVRLPAARNSC
jgi:hypothetical protein